MSGLRKHTLPSACGCPQAHCGGCGFEPHLDILSVDNQWAIDFIGALSEGRPDAHIVEVELQPGRTNC
ncbi:MAG: hypothetical protein QF735_08365 [Phycisphaeraceae bacterium]|nr:hypothetical protein [Phycisphaeraceae bacterium]